MKPNMILLCAALSAPVAALAQSESTDGQGRSLMEEGARLFLKGLQQQMEPALEEFEGFAREIGPQMQSFFLEMGPAFKSLMDEVQDWSAYHPPEMLPNGDIILRRKVEEAPLDSAPDLKNETDL